MYRQQNPSIIRPMMKQSRIHSLISSSIPQRAASSSSDKNGQTIHQMSKMIYCEKVENKHLKNRLTTKHVTIATTTVSISNTFILDFNTVSSTPNI